jgi:hypothetical protein
MAKIPLTATNLEELFYGSGLNSCTSKDMFKRCSNVTNINKAFTNTHLWGTFYSGDNGILSYLPNLVEA